MKLSVIWIDRETARIFHLSNDQMERTRVKATHMDHHTHARDQLDHKREENSLFKDAAANLADSDRILVIGPSVTKHHFQNYLMEQRPQLAKRVAGIETVDHPTDAQIAALAKRFFEKASA